MEEQVSVSGRCPSQVPSTLHITEEWVRKRLNLQLDSLVSAEPSRTPGTLDGLQSGRGSSKSFLSGKLNREDVRSLALPGSYNEKITHLGRSLLGFTRIKHLDLSRNAIQSLEGLDHLKHLETLNLYYNNIASLKEVFHLRHNSKLRELDLRLNPVTKNEPDYRLFVVHMLVNLRRLDDRSVRDTERKAALMQFDTDQACEFEEGVQSRVNLTSMKPRVQPSTTVSKHITSRTELVHSLAARPTALGDDTDELLDLIARSDRVLTPAKLPHTKPGILQQRSAAGGQSTSAYLHTSPPSQQYPALHEHVHEEPNGTPTHSQEDDNPQGDYPVKGNFTSAPLSVWRHSATDTLHRKAISDVESELQPSSAVEQLLEILQGHTSADMGALQTDHSLKCKLVNWLQTSLSSEPHHTPPHEREEWQRLQSEVEALQQQVHSIKQQKGADIVRLQEAVKQRESEAAVLGRQLQLQTAELEEVRKNCRTREEVKQLLEQANMDISTLRQLVQTLQEENASLKAAADRAPSTGKLVELENQITGLQGENQSLRTELRGVIEKHQQEIESSSQLQELAAMLQESHRSLVATNDHLLRELEDTKERHAQEMLQMNINYDHLRKTIDFMKHV